jgi:hypothetical protein
MTMTGTQAVNHTIGYNSHILIIDPDGKLDKFNVVKDGIVDDGGNKWEWDQLDPTMSNMRLRLRVRRITDNFKKGYGDGDTGILSITLTDGSTNNTVKVNVTYIDDDLAPC